MRIIENIQKLAGILSLSSFDGHIAIIAGSGLLTLKTAPVFAFSAIAGPAAILLAATMQGAMKERILAAIAAGLLATVIVMLAAAMGSAMSSFLSFRILRIFGGVALVAIALMMFGLNMSEKIPLIIMLAGFIAAALWSHL